jgi:hypothetical protein
MPTAPEFAGVLAGVAAMSSSGPSRSGAHDRMARSFREDTSLAGTDRASLPTPPLHEAYVTSAEGLGQSRWPQLGGGGAGVHNSPHRGRSASYGGP